VTEENLTPEGEPQETAAPSPEGDSVAAEAGAAAEPHGFGDDAAEMANETEVEADFAGQAQSDELALAKMALEERTLDLQRLQAEYVNYKRRVDRDREVVAENATYKVLSPIIDVLDTIDRAREHGELEGGFKAVADQLERVVNNLGLTRFGEPGDPFDPQLHEALTHLGTDAEVTVTTCQHLAKTGYKIGDRVVRAAQVLVVDPVE
jgi:molecular chaperone GrpE